MAWRLAKMSQLGMFYSPPALAAAWHQLAETLKGAGITELTTALWLGKSLFHMNSHDFNWFQAISGLFWALKAIFFII